MSYLALYRKHRPQTFAEVVGQEHVVTTIQNALSSGRISHAYLFCGSRGTGKTTMAKLLAKALNCQNLQDAEPCNACVHCQRINDQSYMDILEIDAASNRGIDEIRELREKIKLTPAEGTYKVYIIDEVHMLTTEAFNALLKTLEEPPKHAIFILATTEPHRLPMTILSRCQRYDFHRISVDDIVGRLTEVVKLNDAQAETEALQLIAKMAAGGMRDALGMLDQCLTSTEASLNASQVAQIIGVADDTFLYAWVEAISQGKAGKALLALQNALQEGKQAGQLLRSLIQYFRDLLVLQMDQGSELVAVAPDVASKMKKQGAQIGVNHILEMIEILGPAQMRMRHEGDGQLLLEMQIITLSRRFIANENLEESKEDTTVEQKLKPVEVEEKQTPEPIVVEEKELPAMSLAKTQELWEKVQQRLRDEKEIKVLAFVQEGKPSVIDDRWVLAFPEKFEFHKTNAERPENQKILQQAIKDICQQPFKVECVLDGGLEKEHVNIPDLEETVKNIFGEDNIIIMEDE